MGKTQRPKDKLEALREQGALHPRPRRVSDELFAQNDFFDARDIVQVKYEMLRRVQREQWPVARSSRTFGFSRPSYYQAQSAFRQRGLSGLVPRRPGPRRAHKLTEEVMDFIEGALEEDDSLRAPALSRLVRERFGVAVHPRSIERGLLRRQKKRR